MKPGVVMLGVLAVALAGCAGGSGMATKAPEAHETQGDATVAQAPGQQPEGSRWRLVESTLPGLEGGTATGIRIEFVDGRLAGDSGCNRFSAPVSFEGEAMTLGIAMSTKRACLDGRGEAEASLYDALPGLNRAVRVGDMLRLDHKDGGYMLFADDPVVDR